ncbi:MAG: hypothetical protein WCS52_04390 [bacterium]
MIEQDGRVIAVLVPPEEYLPVQNADIPPEFWQGLREAQAGIGVDIETALTPAIPAVTQWRIDCVSLDILEVGVNCPVKFRAKHRWRSPSPANDSPIALRLIGRQGRRPPPVAIEKDPRSHVHTGFLYRLIPYAVVAC